GSSGQLSLTIPAGSTAVSFQVKILNDSIDELNESVLFEILSQSGMKINQGQFTLTILDDDVPSISFATKSFSIDEGAGTHTVVLNLSQPPAESHTALIKLTNSTTTYGSDYTTTPDGSSGQLSLTIPAGSTAVSFQVKILNDSIDELNESVLFEILSQSGM